jgi:hypothetical protein
MVKHSKKINNDNKLKTDVVIDSCSIGLNSNL